MREVYDYENVTFEASLSTLFMATFTLLSLITMTGEERENTN